MAILGAQLIITLVTVSVIQKLSPHFSLAQWFLCSTGLVRYLHPTDQQLKTLAGVPKDKPKKNKHMENGKSGDVFHVPRSLDLTLESSEVAARDIVHMKYYPEYQWFLDFSMYAAVVYILTEVYNNFYPIEDEINLSMLWCTLVLIFAFKVSLSLWLQYFKGEESVGERSTCIVTGFIYLLLAMIILIIDENHLEIGLEKAYDSFNHSASLFLDHQGLPSTGPASKIVIKFFLATWCGLLGSLFTFPGLRVSKMHWDTLRYNSDRKLIVLLANISYASPLLLVCLWIKPITKDYLTVRVFSGMTGPLMSVGTFESARLWMVVAVVLVKLALMPLYLQSYLNLAVQRLENQKKEAGRITNVELQRKIAAVFYYLCVVGLQYVIPLMTLLYFTFMYKTLGDYTWEGITKWGDTVTPGECPIENEESFKTIPINSENSNEEDSVAQTARELRFALASLKQIFSADVCRGLLGLATWWTSFTLFSSTAMGMFYQTYFSTS